MPAFTGGIIAPAAGKNCLKLQYIGARCIIRYLLFSEPKQYLQRRFK